MIGLPVESKYNANPGPGTYNAENSIQSLHNKKGSVRISRAERKALFDEKIKKAKAEPGAGAYAHEGMFDNAKPFYFGLPAEAKYNTNPGPG